MPENDAMQLRLVMAPTPCIEWLEALSHYLSTDLCAHALTYLLTLCLQYTDLTSVFRDWPVI